MSVIFFINGFARLSFIYEPGVTSWKQHTRGGHEAGHAQQTLKLS